MKMRTIFELYSVDGTASFEPGIISTTPYSTMIFSFALGGDTTPDMRY